MQAPPPHYGYAPPHAMMHAPPQQQRSVAGSLLRGLPGSSVLTVASRRPTRSLASDEWKTSLALPPKDERIRTEVRPGVSLAGSARDGRRLVERPSGPWGSHLPRALAPAGRDGHQGQRV